MSDNLDSNDISVSESSSEEEMLEDDIEEINVNAVVELTNGDTKYFPNVPPDNLPCVGKNFTSWEEAFTFYNNYAKVAGFSTRKHTSILSEDGTGYRSRTFTCSRQGKKNLSYQQKRKHKEPRSGVRKRGQTRCSCLASLTMKRLKDGCGWIVSVFTAEHSHPLTSPGKVQFLTSHRNVTPAHRCLMDQLSQANIPTCQQFRLLEIECGGTSSVGCQERDIRNVEREKRQKKLGHDAETLVKYFDCEKEMDENFYYNITTDGGVFDRCFWADSASRSAYAYFGDVVVFDTTYNTNTYGMILAPLVGVNHHRQTVLFGCGLLSNEKTESFIWLFSRFLEAMPGGAAPKVIITDQDQAIGGAIATVFPPTVHRLCLWHITNKFSEKLGPQVYGDYNGALSAVVHNSETPEEFEKRWGHLMSTTPLGGNEWLRSIFAIRERWVPAYVKHLFAAGMTSSQRVESHHSFLKTYVIRKNSLSDFMVRFKHAVSHQRHLEVQSDHVDKSEVPVLLTHHQMEIQMRSVYTKTMFLLFQDELLHGTSYDYQKISSSEDAKVYELSRFDAVSDRKRLVTWSTIGDMIMTCSCKLFEFSGYLCRHILCIMYRKGVRVIPDHYILNRWAKQAKSIPVFVSSPTSIGNGASISARAKMISDFVSLSNEVYMLPDVRNFVMQGLSELKRKAVDMMATMGPVDTSNKRDLSTMLPMQLLGTSVTDGLTVQDPVSMRVKGSGKRMKSSKEKGQSGRKCRRCRKPGHNAKTCLDINLRTTLIDEEYIPDMSNANIRIGDAALAETLVSQGSDNYSVHPTNLPRDAFIG